MSDEKYFPWDSGLPTKPEVDALLKAFPPKDIASGFAVTDEQVRKVVGERCTLIRYRTVCDRWRRLLKRDHRVILYRKKLGGFFCPQTNEVQATTEAAQTHAIRTLRKQATDVALAKPTNEIENSVQQHQLRLLHARAHDLKKDRMNRLPPTVVTEQPKIEPPKAQKR